MPNSRNDWFPTPVWCFEVENHQQLNPILLKDIYNEYQKDREGEKWSNVLGWHSKNDLHKRDLFGEFNQIISRNVLEVATFLNWYL